MASALLALAASPRKRAEASEGKMLCPFVRQNARAPGGVLSLHSARRLSPTHRERQGRNKITTVGVALKRQIIQLLLQLSFPAGCKELLCQAA